MTRPEIRDIAAEEVVIASRGTGASVRRALDRVDAVLEKPVRLVLDPASDIRIGRSAIRRVVLEAAVLGRVVGRRDDDPVREAIVSVPVVGQDRVRQRRRGREAVAGIDQDVHPVGHEDLERGPERRLRERVRVAADEQRPGDPLGPPVSRHARARRDDVRFVERRRERGAAVPRGPERHPLGRDTGIRVVVVVGGDQAIDVDEHRRVGRATGTLVDGHGCRQPSVQATDSTATAAETPFSETSRGSDLAASPASSSVVVVATISPPPATEATRDARWTPTPL